MTAAGNAGSAGAADGLPGLACDYHGRPTRRLVGAGCWVEVLAEGGPRIVGFGLAGGPNVFSEAPDLSWDVGYGRYELLGGHRLWFAPESPECSVPDSTGLTLAALPGMEGGAAGVRLAGAIEPPTGLRREIEVRLDPASPAVSIHHVLRNEGSRTLEFSPWPVTQLCLGGVAFVALPAVVAEHAMKPNQLLALWQYTSWSDERLSLSEGLLTVAARPGPPFKIGCLGTTGRVGYVREGVLFVKRFDPAPESPHADLGCNVEIYCDHGTIELESLGPLVRLGPGESVAHDERWELHEVGESAAPAGLIDRFGLR